MYIYNYIYSIYIYSIYKTRVSATCVCQLLRLGFAAENRGSARGGFASEHAASARRGPQGGRHRGSQGIRPVKMEMSPLKMEI